MLVVVPLLLTIAFFNSATAAPTNLQYFDLQVDSYLAHGTPIGFNPFVILTKTLFGNDSVHPDIQVMFLDFNNLGNPQYPFYLPGDGRLAYSPQGSVDPEPSFRNTGQPPRDGSGAYFFHDPVPEADGYHTVTEASFDQNNHLILSSSPGSWWACNDPIEHNAFLNGTFMGIKWYKEGPPPPEDHSENICVPVLLKRVNKV